MSTRKKCLDDVEIQAETEQVCLALFALGTRERAKIRQIWLKTLDRVDQDIQRITKHTVFRAADEIDASNLANQSLQGQQAHCEKVITEYVEFIENASQERQSIEFLRGQDESFLQSPGSIWLSLFLL